MNRNTWVVIIFSITMLAGTVQAGYRLFDDFEDEWTGPLHGQDYWYSSKGDNLIITDPADSLNQILYVPSQSSVVRKSLLTENTGVPDGTARMVFMRMRVSRKQTFSAGLSPLNSPDEFSDFAPEIGMANNATALDLRGWDNDGDNYEILTQLIPDQWYNIWIYVNAAANHYEIWINGTPGADATPTDKLAAPDADETFDFRSGQNSNLFTFYIKTAGGNSSANFGPVYFDDIYLELSDTLNLANPTIQTEPTPGDADRNGCVNLIDFAALSRSWMSGPDPAVSWEEGNFDFNDTVDITDLLLMAQHWLDGCADSV